MKCALCGNHEAPCDPLKCEESIFFIYLSSSFKEYLNVPCYAREKLDAVTDDVVFVETADNELYAFKLKKKTSKTRIYGADYAKFIHDYNMKKGDMIKLDMNNPHPYLFMYPLDKHGHAKERVQEDFLFKDTAKPFVVSRGLELTPTEIGKINKHIMNYGLGLGVVFVHCMTASDIQSNSLHIPKAIASVLDIPRSAIVFLVLDNADLVVEADYYTSSDGRISFKNGWKELGNQSALEAGVDVVIMFHQVGDDIHIIIHVV